MKSEVELRRFEAFFELSEVRANSRIVEASVSSEFPFQRERGAEILVHSNEAIDLSRGPDLPLLLQHDSSQINVGIATNLHLVGKRLKATLKFGKSTRARYRPKPTIYTGARSIVESEERFGTHADTSDWIVEIYQVDFTNFGGIPLYIGSHTMDPVTVYLSTVSSPVYLVSDGYATEQTIQGDLSGTSVDDFYANISPVDTAQVLSLQSSVDGSVKTGAVLVAENASNPDMRRP